MLFNIDTSIVIKELLIEMPDTTMADIDLAAIFQVLESFALQQDEPEMVAAALGRGLQEAGVSIEKMERALNVAEALSHILKRLSDTPEPEVKQGTGGYL